MAQYELNTTQIALLEALKASLFGIEPNYPEDTDWAEVVKEAKVQTVMGIISPVIPVSDTSTKQGIAKYIKILHEQDKLIKLLDENGIPCVILKGAAAAIYYPKPHLRAMGDVDILVPRNKFDEASKILESNRYIYEHGKDKKGNRLKNGRHFAYNKNGVDFELHHHFSSNGFEIDDILDEAIHRREYHVIQGYKVPVLPDIENGLVLLGHINQHLITSNLGLRQIIDWEMYINNLSVEMSCFFISSIKQTGLYKLALHITKVCNYYLGLPNDIDFSEDVDKSTVRKLLLIIFSNGNFGRKIYSTKDEGRINYSIYKIKQKGYLGFFKDLGIYKLKTDFFLLKPFVVIYGIMVFGLKVFIAFLNNPKLSKDLNDVKCRLSLYEKIGIKSEIFKQVKNHQK